MSWSITILRVAGSEIRVHVTFLILLAWIGFAEYFSGGAAAAVDGVLFMIAVFACVLLHELGHAVAARHYGISTPAITLLAFRLGRRRATELAARIGQGLAFVFGFWGLMSGNVFLVFIAIFVYLAAAGRRRWHARGGAPRAGRARHGAGVRNAGCQRDGRRRGRGTAPDHPA
jgi:Zn-dependent protease